jgi:hypothetical protein
VRYFRYNPVDRAATPVHGAGNFMRVPLVFPEYGEPGQGGGVLFQIEGQGIRFLRRSHRQAAAKQGLPVFQMPLLRAMVPGTQGQGPYQNDLFPVRYKIPG